MKDANQDRNEKNDNADAEQQQAQGGVVHQKEPAP
jgi:hypothetical protein